MQLPSDHAPPAASRVLSCKATPPRQLPPSSPMMLFANGSCAAWVGAPCTRVRCHSSTVKYGVPGGQGVAW